MKELKEKTQIDIKCTKGSLLTNKVGESMLFAIDGKLVKSVIVDKDKETITLKIDKLNIDNIKKDNENNRYSIGCGLCKNCGGLVKNE